MILETFLIVLFLWFWKINSNKSDPPGPFRLPLVGNLFSLDRSLMKKNQTHKAIKKEIEKYGPIIQLKMGSSDMIVVADRDMIDELCKNQFYNYRSSFATHLVWSGYSREDLLNKTPEDKRGILVNDPVGWKPLRKFSFSKLLSKIKITELNYKIEEEVDFFCSFLKEKAKSGESVSFTFLTKCFSQNVICQIGFSKRMQPDYSAKEFPLLKSLEGIFFWLEKGRVINLAPFLKLLPSIKKMWNNYCDDIIFLQNEIKNILSEHRNSQHPPDDLITTILKFNEKEKDNMISEQDIIVLMQDLLIAGTDTTGNTVNFLIALLYNHPEIESKLSEEIQGISKNIQNPSPKELEELPYLNAVINETLRLYPTVPLGLAHIAHEDISIGNYIIRKDASIFPFYGMFCKDERYWKEPEKFIPERFIEDPNLKNSKYLAPFGIGPRICLGRNLAIHELRVLVFKLYQKFIFESPDKKPISTEESLSVTMKIEPFNLIVKNRPIK